MNDLGLVCFFQKRQRLSGRMQNLEQDKKLKCSFSRDLFFAKVLDSANNERFGILHLIAHLKPVLLLSPTHPSFELQIAECSNHKPLPRLY